MRLTIGKSRKDIHWKVVDWDWQTLCKHLSHTSRTPETMSEYKAMSKDERSDRKDVGGFVGGVVQGGRRMRSAISARTLITLDADFAKESTWEDAQMFIDSAMCCYSTHSHQHNLPRLRFVLPLSREVSPDEYEPIARQIAKDIGIELFDVTTYETSRLMYWPSTPSDGEFIFHSQDGQPVDADRVLARYTDWRDTTEWPTASGEQTVRSKQLKAQGKPEEKRGMVGIFCRAYDVPSAISAFLSDVYKPSGLGRYTYIEGSTAGGVVVYENGSFAFSHHATDPAGGHLCNAFDLVRLHKFGSLDFEADPSLPITKLPSYIAMCEFASKDETVKQLAVAERIAEARDAFASTPAADSDDWLKRLKVNKNGAVEPTIENIVLILENDSNIRGSLATNLFTDKLCIIGDTPWAKAEDKVNGTPWYDTDDAALRHYLEVTYGLSAPSKIADALSIVMTRHAFHPVRDYIRGIGWDGLPRGETLFIDYMGAEDNLYTRTVTRKWLTAAVARVIVPGIKFDNMIVLVGAQGIGKSYLGSKLGKHWFSDTFSTVQGKEAYEQLKGHWIVEMGELSVMKKAEVESVKMFISKQDDSYRAAYDRHSKSNLRQCVFYGTTNDDSFLRDWTGNRRFWPIGVDPESALYSVFSLTDYEVDQIWAEAYQWFRDGEKLFLPEKVVKLAIEEQAQYTVDDPRVGLVMDYLDKPVPLDWEKMSKTDRRNYIQGFVELDEGAATYIRDEITVMEIAYEVFGVEDVPPWQAKEYHNILVSLPGWHKTRERKRTVYGRPQLYRKRKGK